MNKGGQSLIEARAYEGLGSYMAEGSEVFIGGAPVEDLQAWAKAADAWKWWHPFYSNRVGWLCFEVGMAAQTHIRLHGAPHLAASEPGEWFERAHQHWSSVADNAANDPADRSRAMLARGAADSYKLAVGYPSEFRNEEYFYDQLGAAALLQADYAEHPHPATLRGLYAQTFMLLLNSVASDIDGLCLPPPPRFYQSGSRCSTDIMLWKGGSEKGVSHLAICAQEERGDWDNWISLWPALLDNGRYNVPSDQGTLTAILDYFLHRKPTAPGKRPQAHMERVADGVWKMIEKQVSSFSHEALSPPADLSLEEARQACQAVGYHFGLSDRPRLEAYIKVFEAAWANDETNEHDNEVLGWLYMDLGRLTDEAGIFKQAQDMFEYVAAEQADSKEPQRYYEAKIAAATARLEQAFRESKESSTIVSAYSQELHEVAVALFNEYDSLDKKSRRYKQLRPLAYSVATSLAVCCGEDKDHIAIIPSPQQRGARNQPSSFDILVIPRQEDDYYPNHASGKVRFQAAPARTVDEGVATMTFSAVHGGAQPNLRDLLSAVTTVSHSLISGSAISADTQVFVSNLREALIENASTVMFF